MRAMWMFLAGALLTACTGGVPGPTTAPPTNTPPTPTPISTPSPLPSPSPASTFYLRASYTQALPPQFTFNWLPVLTIADGTAIDGNVAVPAIYPGPLVITPNARWISDAGIAAVIDEARRLGLLGDTTDFTGGGAMPGSRLGQLRMVVDGRTYDLTGNPDVVVRCGSGRCDAEPGTPEAFAAFWQELSNLEQVLGDEVGALVPYQPDRLAVLLTAPAPAEPGLQQQQLAWPLSESFTTVGVDYPDVAGARCLTVTGDDLDSLFPVLQSGNQLTVFTDADDDARSAMVAVLVPEQDSPCPDTA